MSVVNGVTTTFFYWKIPKTHTLPTSAIIQLRTASWIINKFCNAILDTCSHITEDFKIFEWLSGASQGLKSQRKDKNALFVLFLPSLASFNSNHNQNWHINRTQLYHYKSTSQLLSWCVLLFPGDPICRKLAFDLILKEALLQHLLDNRNKNK